MFLDFIVIFGKSIVGLREVLIYPPGLGERTIEIFFRFP